MLISSAPLADTFGARSGATPGSSDPRFEVLSSPTVHNGLAGGPGFLRLLLGPF